MPQVTRWRSLETWKAAQVVEVLKCALYRGRGWLHWRQLQTEALCAHKLESWERLRPEWWWRSRVLPFLTICRKALAQTAFSFLPS